jgi:hypothetical protein
MVEEIAIPYMIVFTNLNVHPINQSTQVIPGTVSKEDLPRQFYELTVKFIIENSDCNSKWNSIQEFWDFFYSQYRIDISPFSIYFFMNEEWNVFMYNERDLLKLYRIRYDEIYHPELFIQSEELLLYREEEQEESEELEE